MSSANLVTVGVETFLGAHYVFPDMEDTELKTVLPKLGAGVPTGTPSLCLINASFSTLVIPFRVIKKITVNGETFWTAPDCHA